MPSVGEFQELRREVDLLRSQLEQQKGVIQEMKRRCGVSTFRAAREKVIELARAKDELERRLAKKLVQFREKYGEQFGSQ